MAWMISGASSVRRMIRETYASSLPMARASSRTFENLPLSINACQRNARAIFMITGSISVASESSGGLSSPLRPPALSSETGRRHGDHRLGLHYERVTDERQDHRKRRLESTQWIKLS